MDLPPQLREALGAVLSSTPPGELAAAVAGLIARYRTPKDDPGSAAILARPVDVLAYAAYRMPATYAACRAALAELVRAVPELRPRRLLDIGGGTGAAIWAATDAFPEVAELTVLDQVPEALRLGERLARARPGLRSARWEEWTYRGDAVSLPSADLVTVSYLLGELAEPTQTAVVAAAAQRPTRAVVVVEPGTPAGYRRVLAARQALLAAGLRIVAPCPHEQACPLLATAGDWCHFAVRLNRSELHRRAKGAALGYEDEKFSYVAAVRDATAPAGGRPARVLRHPAYAKGLVRLRLCHPAAEGEPGRAQPRVDEVIVSKRQGERYRAARDLTWGAVWPVRTAQDPTNRSVFRENSEN